MSKRGLAATAVAVVVMVGCGTKKDSGNGAGAAPAEKSAPAAMDAQLVEHAKAHASSCTVNEEAAQAYSCTGGVTDAARKYVQDNKPPTFLETLATLAQKKDDPKLAAASAALLVDQFDNLGEDGKRKTSTASAVDLVLTAFKDSKGPRAVRLAKVAAQAATLAKAYPKLDAAIDAQSHKPAREEAYRHLLTFGRLDTFAKVKKGAESDHKRGSLDAVRNMYKPTEAEKAAVCPWSKDFLGDADGEVAASAGYDMVYCRGAYIDALLGEADKRLAAGQFKNPFAAVMREPCFEFMSKVTKSAADEAQCEKVYTFLEKATNDPKVDDATRGLALWNIYYQRRDDKTLKLMRKYENNPNKEISKRAKEAIKSLTETYKLKG